MNTQIYDEASEWVVRHRSDGLDAKAKRRFDAWLRESPQHVHAYLEMSSIWESVPALDPGWNACAEELIARAKSNVFPLGESANATAASTAPKAGQVRSRAALGLFFSLAASLVMAIGSAGWLYSQRGVYATGIGEQRTIALADGSSIELNARSRIKIRYADRERAIDLLQGQAFFRVAKDVHRPFVVQSGATEVRAVGTRFDVYKKSTGTLVTVVEGRVAVLTFKPGADIPRTADSVTANGPEPANAAASAVRASAAAERASNGRSEHALERASSLGEVLLDAGEQLLVAQTAAPRVTKPENIEAATGWTQQRLVFEFTPLTEVAEEFNRYNSRPLVIEDPSLQGFHVSGSFSSTDPTLLLRFLREQPGIAVNETADEIRIARREAGAG